MDKEDLIRLKQELSKLDVNEQKERDLYLKQLLIGKIAGPLTGYPSIDKPWLKNYSNKQIEDNLVPMSVYSYLYQESRYNLEQNAINYYGHIITFEELFLRIDEVAKSLKAIGIEENEVVTIIMPTTPELVYLFYAISKIGAIASIINQYESEKFIQDKIINANSKKVFVIDWFYNKVNKISEANFLDRIVVVSPTESLSLGSNFNYKVKEFFGSLKEKTKKIIYNESTINWKDFINDGKSCVEDIEVHFIANKPFLIEYSADITNEKNGVVLTNENINSIAFQNKLFNTNMEKNDRWFNILPAYVPNGISMGIHMPLSMGLETIITSHFDSRKDYDILTKYKTNHVFSMPDFWSDLINDDYEIEKELFFVSTVIVNQKVVDYIYENEVNHYLDEKSVSSNVVNTYGLSETSGSITLVNNKSNKNGSLGIPYLQNTIGIFEANSEYELGYKEAGEVCVTGPSVMLNYYKNENDTNKVLKKHRDGKIWLHTNKAGYITENGNLFVMGDLEDLIILDNGCKYFSSIIENVIATYEGVKECKVVAANNKEKDEASLRAYIVLKDEYVDKKSEIHFDLRVLCGEKLLNYAKPTEYVFLDALPVTPDGKIDYLALETYDMNNNANVYQRRLVK